MPTSSSSSSFSSPSSSSSSVASSSPSTSCGCGPRRTVEKAWRRRVRAPLHLVCRGRHASVEFLSLVRLHARSLSRVPLSISFLLLRHHTAPRHSRARFSNFLIRESSSFSLPYHRLTPRRRSRISILSADIPSSTPDLHCRRTIAGGSREDEVHRHHNHTAELPPSLPPSTRCGSSLSLSPPLFLSDPLLSSCAGILVKSRYARLCTCMQCAHTRSSHACSPGLTSSMNVGASRRI